MTTDQSCIDQTSSSLLSTAYCGKCAVIIPTYNASSNWPALHLGLLKQPLGKSQILIVDSSSTDGTSKLAQQAGYKTLTVPKETFRHSKTRQLAASFLPDADYLVYMTQDAILSDESSICNLLRSFNDSRVGAVYGRQLPRPQANAIEKHGRNFNYPAESANRDFSSRFSLGFRTAYFSNSFAAYRRSAFEDVFGFPDHVAVSEDVSVAARMLLKGWHIAYASDAHVIHSHDLSLGEEFSRYFDISVHHQQERWLIDQFGPVGGEGRKFVRSELRFLADKAWHLIPIAVLRSALKWTAYQLGQHESSLPLFVKRRLSSYPNCWTDEGSLRTAETTSCNLNTNRRVK